MTFYEYEKAKKSLELQMKIVKGLKADNSGYAEHLQKYLEMLIIIKGHAWCMDVASERRKMAKLVVSVISL